jgi:phosphoserine phosphatase
MFFFCTLSAMESAAADLPLAVAPATMRILGRILGPEVEFMELVITLIAHQNRKAPLTQGLIDTMVTTLGAQGIPVKKQAWLAEHIACDLFITHSNDDAMDARVRAILGMQPVDVVVQPAADRRKQLLISDMDSTMITVECIDELADFVGKKAQVAQITERAMNGELNFEAALTERVALLAGLPEETLTKAYTQRVTMMPGARELVATMVKHDAYCVLVSGGFTFFTERVAQELGFHENHANRLEIEDGKLTGRVIPPILGKEAKLDSLKNICAIKRISRENALAVGDGANDLPMLQSAGLGIAYHAKPTVIAQSKARISHCDLRALLYVQGYRDEEISAAA